jgi:threonine/homoserine/homoserine lactone efflux protein
MPSLSSLWPVVLFAFAMTFSPGPNTMMISSFSSVFGVRATLPCAAGITAGIAGLVLAAGLGLGTLVAAHPNFGLALRVGGLIYVAWLIWKILSASEFRTSADAKPIGFIGTFALQWINPKAWAMALGIVSAFSPIAAAPNGAIIIAAIFFVLLIPATLLWSAFGAGMSRLLGRGLAFRIFNWTMAALIVSSMAPVLLGP